MKKNIIRKALIIYCDDTGSPKLAGPPKDYENLHRFLTSGLGGHWKPLEIMGLHNPTCDQVANAVSTFLKVADYTLVVFTGHGYIEVSENKRRQLLELQDKYIPVNYLKTGAPRQLLIVDSCRAFELIPARLIKSLHEEFKNFSGQQSTRDLLDKAVMRAETGWTIAYAAGEGESARDSENGGAYLLSLLEAAFIWAGENELNNILPFNEAHENAKLYLADNFNSIQSPQIEEEKRMNYFPFAVKYGFFNK